MATDVKSRESTARESITAIESQPVLRHRAGSELPAPAQGERLSRPESTMRPTKIAWQYATGVGLVHLLALLAFSSYFFSWTGVVLAVMGLYVYGTLGINLCYHRLLTHQGFVTPRWLEHLFATLGVCCLQDTPARWVAIHRLHHKYSDERMDPHSPLVNFFWGHMGWLLIDNRDVGTVMTYERLARDLLRDRFYFRLERKLMWLWVYLGHAALYFGAGAAIATAAWGPETAVQFGASLVVWGVLVRTVAVWHITWSVNSLTHIWGYQNYDTGENSRNNWFVALVSNGEGWHNNHHADQRAAAHGHHWWEFDVTWLTIRALQTVGLAKEIVPPRIWSRA